jgi:hypothetical protein
LKVLKVSLIKADAGQTFKCSLSIHWWIFRLWARMVQLILLGRIHLKIPEMVIDQMNWFAGRIFRHFLIGIMKDKGKYKSY